MDCELCGRPNAIATAIVEGVRMSVCERCAKHGKVVARIYDGDDAPSTMAKTAKREIEIVDDYADIIKNARTKKGMTIRQLAAAVAEKESYMDRIEREETTPTEQAARKLEKFLNIRLMHEVELARTKEEKGRSEPITLGDVIEIKRKKK